MDIESAMAKLKHTDRIFAIKGNITLTIGTFIGLYICLYFKIHPLAAGLFMSGITTAISIEASLWYHNYTEVLLGYKPKYIISTLDGLITASGTSVLASIIQIAYIYEMLPEWLMWKY